METIKAIFTLVKAVVIAVTFFALAGFAMTLGMGIILCMTYQF